MKAKPCPKCKSNDLNVGDCGYSSFNVAWVRCKNCRLSVKIFGDSAVGEWNEWAKDPIRMLIKEIREKTKERRRIKKETTIDVSEYAADLISDLIADKDK